ncbi:dynein axonemal heavy chain 1 [Leuresthes tenuis]|uniref:dynein axonemal heavy chain 1 n=1 Tax=Leuresthes tenuis TaxID=355514 RepID=UPI003B514328
MEKKVFGKLVPHPPSKPPDSKPPHDDHGYKHPSRFVNHQIGRSEIISTIEIQSCTERPDPHQRSQGLSSLKSGDLNSPKVSALKTPPNQSMDNHEPDSQRSKSSYFSLGGDRPKVQMPYKTTHGQLPRKLAIERCRREYLKLDLEQLLAEKGINSNILIPKYLKNSNMHKTTSHNPVSLGLPLELFDNEDFDCRTPEDWLALGNAEGARHRQPIPAKALLPKDDERPDNPRSPYPEFSWHLVGVLDYSKEKYQYLVQKVYQSNRWTDEEGNSGTNEEHNKKKSLEINPLQVGSKYWVPRIRLLFSAEDPRVFAERISFALRFREDIEAQLLYNLSVDCMPIWQKTPSLNTDSLQRVKKLAVSTPGLRLKILEKCLENVEKEVRLEYDRTMNRMIFDKVVMSHAEEFPYVTLPQRDPEYVPQKGCVPVPHFTYERNRDAFDYICLLIKPELMCLISEIWSECSKVANMRLFNVTSIKPLRLDEFELIQSHLHTQIKLYLQEEWTVTLGNNIRSTLCTFGKGAYNMNETRLEMYKYSKLCRLMNMVLFNMQDSVRYLVQDSLVSLTECLMETCHSVLTCPQDLVWGKNLINSPYKPKRNPLFLVDLVLDHSGVHYSTPMEDFKTSVLNLFDEGILATHKIPKLDKFVLKSLFAQGDSLLRSVNLCEPEVKELRKKVHNALVQAAVPLRAYAAEYEKHLDLHNLDIETLLKSHNAEQTAREVKRAAEQHLKEKEGLEHSLPSSIVIGPFFVRVEAVRQSLTKKRKALASALLDQLALRLSKQIETACEECNILSRKLREKPNSIEELTEKREWMKHIPKQLKSYKEHIGKTLSDYEVIDGTYYCLTNEDVNKKWTAIGWPHKIICQMQTITIQHEEDEERFHKIQLSDQSKFEDNLDFLRKLIAGFASYGDIDHAHEIANKVKRTSKQLKECQTMAKTYNTRQHLLGLPILNYDHLEKLIKDFQPFKDLWTTTSDWLRWNESWLSDPLSSIDPEQLERNMIDAQKTMKKCVTQFKDIAGVQVVTAVLLSKIEDFWPCVPLIKCLRNPGMMSRHWDMLSERIHVKVKPKANLNLSHYLELGLQNHGDDLTHVVELAGKEYAIEQTLEKMEEEWSTVVFDLLPYKETGTYILKSPDKAFQMLDHDIVVTQSMSFSPFKKAFEGRIDALERKLRMTQDVLEEWVISQRAWMYLEPIFSLDDINQQLPVEGKIFQQMEQQWKSVMRSAFNNRKVIELCTEARLLQRLKYCNTLSEKVQKGLIEYLKKKRGSFPRFFFLSDNELLEILSHAKDPTAIQPHLRKCFENIVQLQFQSDLQITHMYSEGGEEVKLFLPVWPTGNAEAWLRDVEMSMKATLRENIDRSLKVYSEQPRPEWVLSWPGQVVIAGCQVVWTAQVSDALEHGDLAHRLYPQLQSQLDDLVQLMRGHLSKIQQAVLSSLIVVEVHAKDVAAKLVQQEVSSIDDFEWISQLRYYWTKEDLYARAVDAEFLYGYEYLGNSSRLVVTPLTDRCYLTLTGALNLKFGGALAGPTGTGKTETVKDLGKALAIRTVIFNCSDQLDFVAASKFLKGLASSGAWACFDDINCIDVEVLSVMAQQISTIQKAQQQRAERFVFDGAEISLVPSCAVFFTMNPGCTGCMKIPDNLKVLFRPVAMMVPDYALIAEISLYSFGFRDARVLSKKIATTFRLSSGQLSSQDHYDFGMRAVKSVISVAGNMKKENSNLNEELICLRAIQDVSLPKLLQDDLNLFGAIVSDLFRGTKQEPINYGTLKHSLCNICATKNLKDVDGYINKCVQLYETTVVRHGVMLVGPPGSGKTKCYETVGAAITALEGKDAVRGGVYEAVQIHVLNPKSITLRQLYGEYDSLTHDWTDGVLSALMRGGAASKDKKKKWYMFDGPVDAVWIENMNTVLDDNKRLCLSSGEIIKLTNTMTVMFEVQDLAAASPATVSRCAMVYLDPSILGLSSLTECWLKQVSDVLKPYKEQLKHLFSGFLEDSITFVRTSVKEVITSLDSNLICSLLKLMDCFFSPLNVEESERRQPQLKRLRELIEPGFFFSLVWSIGATGDAVSRQRFSAWLKNKMAGEKITLCFPEGGLVYDYRLDDAGIINPEDEEDQVEREVQWVRWMEYAESVIIAPETNFADIFVPTADTVRTSFLIDMLLTNKKPVLCVGPSGTGKTAIMLNKLLKNMPAEYIAHVFMFSAHTSANQAQDFIDSRLNKRRRGVLGPPVGKQFIFFIDDLNMPMLGTHGSQPPIELLRQWMDHGGWYNRKQIGTFDHLVDINFACAMETPGGGRNPITQRFTRHFNILSVTEMEDASKKKIFSTILESWMGPVSVIQPLNENLVDATIRVYAAVTSHLLPTPPKSHYTFNLRDLSKVFQGIVMAEASMIEDKPQLLQLWYHESCRVFQDRLVCTEDREWLNKLLKDCIQEFDCCFDEIMPCHPVLYGDFMIPGAGGKVYTLIEDKETLTKVMEKYMEDYNQSGTTKMKLVLFMDAIEHVCRINRILRQPLGNALLLGVGGSGRRSLTKLASYMSGYECFQIEPSKNYGRTEWREDIKKLMLKAGLQNQKITFLFADPQVKKESFLEDINYVLKSGDIPNLYAADEQECILTKMRPVVRDRGQLPTKENLMAAFIRRVRSNVHTVVCISPVGEVFRARMRRFPSLVTCCTIDWFNTWPEEALQAVATSFLNELPELEVNPTIMRGLTLMCVRIHQMVVRKSEQYLAELSRHNYVTPKSYLELLKIFSDLNGCKQIELRSSCQLMRTGLDKLRSTAEHVSKMQEELEIMKPLLEEAAKDAEVTMEAIKKETIVAEETRKSVQEVETKASEKARFVRAIAADAQRDRDKALQALDAAIASLQSLSMNTFAELQAIQQPPQGVKLVLEAVCKMQGIEPNKVPGEKPDTSVDDYFEPAKDLLQDPSKFLESLLEFDKDNIPDDVISSIQPYIDNEEFQPDSMAEVSKVCTPLCQWVRAMHAYHFVAKAVEPKQQALQEAQKHLTATQNVLNDGKKRLTAVEGSIATLQAKYHDYQAQKNELHNKYQLFEARLIQANRLISGLAEEEACWREKAQHLDNMVNNLAGDVLLCAGYVAYLGPFTGEYRAAMAEDWLRLFKDLSVPHTDTPDLLNTLGDPVKIQSWQMSSLPMDDFLMENSVIAQYSLRWPLFIDPQGQANKWIRNMERDNSLKVMKLSDQDFLHSLENAIRFGKPCLLENVGEELDLALEPVLLQQTFKQQGNTVLSLGDSVIPYHEGFRMYITTKLPNPHYSSEVSDKVTLINSTLSPSGLEDQLLCRLVAEERPDLEEARNQLIISNAVLMKQELKQTEDEILHRLSSMEENPVDNEELILMLEASKIKVEEIKAKVMAAEKTEQDIDATRLQYVPVAVRARLLFFCVLDLSNLEPMYHYSLEWFIGIFMTAVANSNTAETVEKRITNINELFTFSLYSRVCHSLFDKHRLVFAFFLCARIMMSDNKINMAEWRYLLSGGIPVRELTNPAGEWLSERAWQDILGLSTLENFSKLAESFIEHVHGFKKIFDSNHPHREPLPGEWNSKLDSFQKLLILRCLRADSLIQGLQDFVSTHLGERFIEPQTSDLSAVFEASSPVTPLILVLTPGTDPAAHFYSFADVMQFSKKTSAISLGQGQGPLAETMMRAAMERGQWVFFQNCHLALSWMPTLERLTESIDPVKVHKDFRLWLTSLPSSKFPVSILQNGSKITVESPRGIKAKLQKTYMRFTNDFNFSSPKTGHLKSLLLSLCLFHGIALERRKFGPLGLNIPYEFTDDDLNICISQLKTFLDMYQDIPYKVLKYTAGEIIYGGRVTDDWDRRCLLSVLEDFYCPAVLSADHVYSSSGIYRQIDSNLDVKAYLAYIRGLPINDTPEVFGLHDNANIRYAQSETFTLLEAIVRLQPRATSSEGKSQEEMVEEIVAGIVEKVPQPFSIQEVIEKYPVLYEESMNTVLVHEVIRYNKLLEVISQSLSDVVMALKGLEVMSSELELMARSLLNNMVPDMWKAKAYPSLKPLASWVSDLLQRIGFLQRWISNGFPPVFWISGLFFPQAFLTGTLQDYARRSGTSFDTIGFDTEVMVKSVSEITEIPNTGCYIHGLFLEGACWDKEAGRLRESRPKELYTQMAVIWLVPKPNRKPPTSRVYICPIYKTLRRAGTPSTSGHSTDCVTAVELPTDHSQRHWIKRGVALICALDY